MKIIKTISEMKAIRNSSLFNNKTIGFVPTLAGLHIGHQSLMRRSVADNEITILSIFLNPTQFNDPNDLETYPDTLEQDFELAKAAKVDFVFTPDAQSMYPDDFTFRVEEHKSSLTMEGAFRPGYFSGVFTIVLKLLNIIKPHKLYLGEKDYQQSRLLEKMCEAFFLETQIVHCVTIRDENGLAYSTRNMKLSPEDLALASKFNKIIAQNKSNDAMKADLIELGFEVDYLEDFENRCLAAVRVGGIRLLDNVKIK